MAGRRKSRRHDSPRRELMIGRFRPEIEVRNRVVYRDGLPIPTDLER